MSDAIRGDGIRPDDNQWKRPELESDNIGDPIEPGQQEETPAPAIECPARGTDSLDDRADAQPADHCAGHEADASRYEEPFYPRNRRPFASNNPAGDQTKDHSAER